MATPEKQLAKSADFSAFGRDTLGPNSRETSDTCLVSSSSPEAADWDTRRAVHVNAADFAPGYETAKKKDMRQNALMKPPKLKHGRKI